MIDLTTVEKHLKMVRENAPMGELLCSFINTLVKENSERKSEVALLNEELKKHRRDLIAHPGGRGRDPDHDDEWETDEPSAVKKP